MSTWFMDGPYLPIFFIASCYHMNNILGLLACSTFIGSNFALALNISTQEWTTLDIFLCGITMTNYLFMEAIVQE